MDLRLHEAVFDASVYSKNQARLLEHEVADLFLAEVVEMARQHGWVSEDHFSVDGTLIEAWATMKRFRPKGDDQQEPGRGNAWMSGATECRQRRVRHQEQQPDRGTAARTTPRVESAARSWCGQSRFYQEPSKKY